MSLTYGPPRLREFSRSCLFESASTYPASHEGACVKLPHFDAPASSNEKTCWYQPGRDPSGAGEENVKSYQIDGRTLRTGAANFSASGLKRQDNDLTPLIKPDQQLAHKGKPADGVHGCGAARFQGFQLYKSFAKNFRHRLPNVPFQIKIHRR
jgi:hypothetical protein